MDCLGSTGGMSATYIYINDNLDKRTWTYIFGACCATTVFIHSFHNYRVWSFLGLLMTTYTAWYLTNASILHGQRNNACDVEAAEVYVYLPVCDSVRSDADAAFCVCGILSVWRFASKPFKCIHSPSKEPFPRLCSGAHAHPPIHHVWVRLHASILRVGEADRHARVPEHVQESRREASCGYTHLVSGNHIPFLRSH
ncbi:uncharacterized protein LOC106452299 [Brassica napus]|uniref:uncharacterized protein LOC106452299 n=1 Tax=Brassica napus TaxID=3708 RepID=UPI00207895CD|nr:uncharacterized protein LOC106452299 [Brassica napus]